MDKEKKNEKRLKPIVVMFIKNNNDEHYSEVLCRGFDFVLFM